MAAVVIDTHAAIWYLLQSPRLSSRAAVALDKVVRAGDNIYLPSISLVEVIYLTEKGRVSQLALDRLLKGVQNPDSSWIVAPLDLSVAQTVAKLSRDVIPDMPDRIIAATALHLDLPLITCDSKLQNSQVKVIW